MKPDIKQNIKTYIKLFLDMLPFFIGLAIISRLIGGSSDVNVLVDMEAVINKLPDAALIKTLYYLFYLICGAAGTTAVMLICGDGNKDSDNNHTVIINRYDNKKKSLLGICCGAALFSAWYPLVFRLREASLAMTVLCGTLILFVWALENTSVKCGVLNKALYILLLASCALIACFMYFTLIYKILL